MSDAAPQFGQVDAWGLTHIGKVRTTNQDHFFAGALSRGVTVDASSLDAESVRCFEPERLASLGIVADGVGGSADGELAARIAVQALVKEVSARFHGAERREAHDPDVFSRLLHDAALNCHESLLALASDDPDGGPFATTLTLFLGLWPQAYLLQLGDSRCYVYQDGELRQVTRDQTWAQDLVDGGVLTPSKAQASRWASVLTSAAGGSKAMPVVTRIVRDWGAVVLLCSDGLTKHVPDRLIRERIKSMESSRQLCETLLNDALDDGGTDNVTIVVGRTLRPSAGEGP